MRKGRFISPVVTFVSLVMSQKWASLSNFCHCSFIRYIVFRAFWPSSRKHCPTVRNYWLKSTHKKMPLSVLRVLLSVTLILHFLWGKVDCTAKLLQISLWQKLNRQIHTESTHLKCILNWWSCKHNHNHLNISQPH